MGVQNAAATSEDSLAAAGEVRHSLPSGPSGVSPRHVPKLCPRALAQKPVPSHVALFITARPGNNLSVLPPVGGQASNEGALTVNRRLIYVAMQMTSDA